LGLIFICILGCGFFWEGCSGFLAGFGGLLGWVGLLSEQVWVFVGGFFRMLGFGCSLWVSGFRVVLCGFVWVLSFMGWLWWFLCILSVYLGAPYAF
jgi:hypothetical protein